MKLIFILFFVLLIGCTKQSISCMCNDDFVFKNTNDTSLCNKPIEGTIKYRYWIMQCPPPVGNVLIVDSTYSTHNGFKRYIVN